MMKRLERALERLEAALEGGGPALIVISYERPDGPPLEPSDEAKRRALREARRQGKPFALVYPEEASQRPL